VVSLCNNYLLYKNFNKDVNNAHIISLKNQASEKGIFLQGDSLGLSSTNPRDFVNYREYTCIANDIDRETDESLVLNYTHYNSTISINPGKNYFRIADNITPLTHININHTPISKQGAFSSGVPLYADKIYQSTLTKYNTDIHLLCTWLSGGLGSSNPRWIDRYYYPNFINKQQALSGRPISNSTYLDPIESGVVSTAALSTSVLTNQYFDLISSLTFRPSSTYIYERLDPNTINFKNEFTSLGGNYYTAINSNGGYVLSFDVKNYTASEYYVVRSIWNEIQNGVYISFNRDYVSYTFSVYNTVTQSTSTITNFTRVPSNISYRVTVNVNSDNGKIKIYINDKLYNVTTSYAAGAFTPLNGNFITSEGDDITALASQYDFNSEKENYIDNIFIKTSPFSDVDLENYVAVEMFKEDDRQFYVTLPCGMRNSSDEILQINNYKANQKNKASNVNVNINGLNIKDSATINELYDYLAATPELLPATVSLESIKVT
jgi:hypothetical protein